MIRLALKLLVGDRARCPAPARRRRPTYILTLSALVSIRNVLRLEPGVVFKG